MKFWIAEIASIVLDWSKLEFGDSLYAVSYTHLTLPTIE